MNIIDQQVKNGVSFDFIGGDGYYGNDAKLVSAIDQMVYIYILDIHSDKKIFINRPKLFLFERKSTKESTTKRLNATTPDMSVTDNTDSFF